MCQHCDRAWDALPPILQERLESRSVFHEDPELLACALRLADNLDEIHRCYNASLPQPEDVLGILADP